jgi:phosphatidylserine decarboxylase
LTDSKSPPTSASTAAPASAPAPVVEDKDLKQYIVPLKMKHEIRWQDKHTPELVIKTKYVPYAALRQQFWRCLLNQYEIDESGHLTRLELVTMLDALGSTLSEATINSFFERYQEPAKDADQLTEVEEISIDHAVICLEEQLLKQSKGPANKATLPTVTSSEVPGGVIDLPEKQTTPANPADLSLNAPEPDNGSDIGALQDPDDKTEEHVIMIVECPLCHQPRLNKRSEVDIVTHLATCASQDWRQVNTFVMAGFVTPDQAHRKWYTKVPPPYSLR